MKEHDPQQHLPFLGLPSWWSSARQPTIGHSFGSSACCSIVIHLSSHRIYPVAHRLLFGNDQNRAIEKRLLAIDGWMNEWMDGSTREIMHLSPKLLVRSTMKFQWAIWFDRKTRTIWPWKWIPTGSQNNQLIQKDDEWTVNRHWNLWTHN